jgi:hypothetical protein
MSPSLMSSHFHMYLYQANRYLFPDINEMRSFSFQPSIEIEKEQVVFTFNQGPAIYYKQELISSFSEALLKIPFPKEFSYDFLESLAKIINYLAVGDTYTYALGTAQKTDSGLLFQVTKESVHYQVTLSSFTKQPEIYYEIKEGFFS